MTQTTPYYTPQGGLPGQTELLTDRAIVTEAYTVIPRGVQCGALTAGEVAADTGFDEAALAALARPREAS